MPQATQIVPKHQHPYVDVVINDNSEQDMSDVVSSTTDETYPYLAVFASGKGIDNKLVSTESLKSLYSRYGSTSYKLYGQPMLTAEAILSQPNTKVWTMRVMPDDATYANSILSLWYKKDVAKKKFRIKATVKSLSKYKDNGEIDKDMETILSDRSAIIAKAKELDGESVSGKYVDAEGYTQVPCAVWTSAGRGVYGNNYKWRISRAEDYEKEYNFKFFTFECYDTDNGTTVAGRYTGSLVSSGKTTDLCFINDVLEEAGDAAVVAPIHVFEENMEDLYDEYVSFVKELTDEDPSLDIEVVDIDCFDPFFGKQLADPRVKVTPDDEIVKIIKVKTDDIDENAEDEHGEKIYDMADYTSITSDKPTEPSAIVVNEASGTAMYGGDDGAFTVDKTNDPTGEKRQAAMDAEYIKAFDGSKDHAILSARRVPANALFDANYSDDVKQALTRLALFRNDALLYLDCGLEDSINSNKLKTLEKRFSFINEMAEEFDPFYPWTVSVNLHYYNIKEAMTGKSVPVSITYFLASLHPNHWRSYGYHVPMVGQEYATLSGHKKNSLYPIIEEYEDDLMDLLFTYRFNYFECIGENQYYRGTQSTWMSNTTDLLEENNVNTLFYLKRSVTEDVRAELYDFTDETTRADFRTYIKAKYQPMVGNQILSIDVKYDVTEWEFNRSIVHLYLAVQFRQLAKRAIVEIDINKRTLSEEEE